MSRKRCSREDGMECRRRSDSTVLDDGHTEPVGTTYFRLQRRGFSELAVSSTMLSLSSENIFTNDRCAVRDFTEIKRPKNCGVRRGWKTCSSRTLPDEASASAPKQKSNIPSSDIAEESDTKVSTKTPEMPISRHMRRVASVACSAESNRRRTSERPRKS